MTFKCELIVNSDVEHLRQIYTGFSLLHRMGFLKLTQTIPNEFLQNKANPNRWVNYKFYNTKAILDEKIVVYYDTHDWNWIDEKLLSEADFYFKRSYDKNFIQQLKDGAKVFPLGLNYQVSDFERNFFQLQRTAFYRGKDKVKAILKAFHIGKYGETEQLDSMESQPDFNLPPKVLFMARAWDTNLIENKAQKESVQQLNETRAQCIKLLRKEFGGNFFGGLAHEDYAVKNFKDCLLPDNDLSNKRKYLEVLKGFPICVTTVGLNGSNGWKLGEYVAFSKAIVSERLQFDITGDFAEDKNYLEFSAPEECVECAVDLFENKDKRELMMQANHTYYLNCLRPDKLIYNTLQIALNL